RVRAGAAAGAGDGGLVARRVGRDRADGRWPERPRPDARRADGAGLVASARLGLGAHAPPECGDAGSLLLAGLAGGRSPRAHFTDGSDTRPMKTTRPLVTSRIRNRNGWSARNSTMRSGRGRQALSPKSRSDAVAAAASVPFSSVFTNALWKTSETNRRSRGSGGFAMP